MVLRGFVLSTLVFLGCTTALHAQSIPAPPPLCTTSVSGDTGTITCPQGTSFYYDLGQVYDPLVAVFAQYSGIDGLFFKYSFAATGGSLPPGLTLSPSGVFSGTLTTAGTFDFSFTISISFGAEGMTLFSDSSASPAIFVVTPYSGPQVSVDSSALSFNLTANAAPVTESVTIANHGGQAASFSASATTNSGGNWLTLSPAGSVVDGSGCQRRPIPLDAGNLFGRHHYCCGRPDAGHLGTSCSIGFATEHSDLSKRTAIPGRHRRNRDVAAVHHGPQFRRRNAELRSRSVYDFRRELAERVPGFRYEHRFVGGFGYG
jgi:hypothetical protein